MGDSGVRVGNCEILSLIGAGGMGKVYKARDTRLGREVAVKMLAERFTADPARIARLEREARILASLNHPNIASIYSLEECDGVCGLVMEYVDGPTLAERIKQGLIRLEEALPLARQMAEAVHYAHERGIIHRDLKPANVKVTSDGTVKVLDFGIAKALEDGTAPDDSALSRTLTLTSTSAGVILGTAAYMSPEQARGELTDTRTDTWAFGVVLFEMLTGKQLFAGETVSDTLASVLKQPIDWASLAATTPPVIRRLLRRCLVRDRNKRLQNIGDALLDIEEALEGSPEQFPIAPRRRAVVPWILVGVLAICLAVLAYRNTDLPEQPLMRLSFELGPNAALTSGSGVNVTVSPDGSRLVYVATGPDRKQQLVTRLLDRTEAMPLAGTEGARDPFFSPDGQWVGFFANGKLKKIAVTGGAVVVLCDALNPLGGSWGEDGSIVASLRIAGPLWKIPSGGGLPQPLAKLDEANGERSHRWPQILPGGTGILFTAGGVVNMEETGSVAVQSVTGKSLKVLRRGAYYGRYLPSGHLLYVQRGTLFAVGFNPATWELMGAPVPVVQQVAGSSAWGSARFDFSRKGTLIYSEGKATGALRSLMWLDGGILRPLPARPAIYSFPRLSPDGKRLAVNRGDVGDEALWVYDWQRDVMIRLSKPGGYAVWSTGGKHLAISSGLNGPIEWIRADASGAGKRLISSNAEMPGAVAGPYRDIPFSFSPDNRRLAFFRFSNETSWDIWTLPLEGGDSDDPKPGQPELFLRTPFAEWAPAFSPDGRWLAYGSNESGNFEIYVQPFPSGGARWLVSRGGGITPAWSRTKPELFYGTGDGHIMVAKYAVKGESFIPQAPRLWSEKQVLASTITWGFDLAPDGQRVIALMPTEPQENEPQTKLTFLVNFFDELRRRVAAGTK